MRQFLIEIEGLPSEMVDREVSVLIARMISLYFSTLIPKLSVEVSGARLLRKDVPNEPPR